MVPLRDIYRYNDEDTIMNIKMYLLEKLFKAVDEHVPNVMTSNSKP